MILISSNNLITILKARFSFSCHMWRWKISISFRNSTIFHNNLYCLLLTDTCGIWILFGGTCTALFVSNTGWLQDIFILSCLSLICGFLFITILIPHSESRFNAYISLNATFSLLAKLSNIWFTLIKRINNRCNQKLNATYLTKIARFSYKQSLNKSC